jgi:hypothetical protein
MIDVTYKGPKQPEDPDIGVSGNAKQRRRVVRAWRARGLKVTLVGGGLFLVGPTPSPYRPVAVVRQDR